jgi:hypothetical protein
MTPDFRVFQVLQSHRIPFVIIGGHAVSFHGYVRGTVHADILWDRTASSEASLVAARPKDLLDLENLPNA